MMLWETTGILRCNVKEVDVLQMLYETKLHALEEYKELPSGALS